MESSLSSLNYLRAVEQLEKKTEEVEHVFTQARRLERENTTLAQENAALREERDALAQDVARLEAQNREWREEFGVLETQVRQQQQHLQEHIEREFTRMQEEALRGREQGAEVIAQQQREQEQKRKQSALLEAKCRRLKREVAQLRRALAVASGGSQPQHGHHTTQTHERTCDGAVMSEIEARALAGVRGELAAFAAENERLMNALDVERDARVAAESGVEHLQQLLQRQRDLSEQQLQLAKQELHALNVQNDTLLLDLRRLMGGDAQNSGDANKAAISPKGTHAKGSRHHQRFTVDRGTITTEVHLNALQLPARTAENTTDVQASTTITKEAEAADFASTGHTFAGVYQTGTHTANTYMKELLHRVHDLEQKISEQKHIIREKEANERVLEERAALHADERQHLRAILEQAVTLERNRDSSNIVQAVADTELNTVLEALIDLLRLYVDCVARLRARLFPKSITTESALFPLVPCREYGSPHLNAIFTHIGGIRHIATIIDDLGERNSVQAKEQQQEPDAYATLIREKAHGISTASSAKPHEAITRMHPSPLQPSTVLETSTRTTSAIGAWLEARKHNLHEQHHNTRPFRTDSTIHTQSTPNQVYRSGETLADAAKQLHDHSLH